jgi:predicted NBD/HSP70 family sugar kinase
MVNDGALSLAIDLGGTTLLIGAVNRNGSVVRATVLNSGYRSQRDALEAIMSGVETFLSGFPEVRDSLIVAGAGLVGQVDPIDGVWHCMYSENDCQEIPLARWITDRYGLPCFLDNDVKAATFAERVFGVGRSCDNFAYVNIGTGIAAGFVSGGRLLRGRANNAGEIGHMVVDLQSSIRCSCGAVGCVEAIASGRAMQLRFEALAQDYPESRLARLMKNQGFQLKHLFQLADAGDRFAQQIAYEAVDAVCAMVANIVAAVSPDKIVFGGGVMADGWLIEHVRERLPDRARTADIVLSSLDLGTIGLVGASVVGFGGLTNEPLL